MIGRRVVTAAIAVTVIAPVWAAPADPLNTLPIRQAEPSKSSGESVVDLGYGLYNGTLNQTVNQLIWLGIPFARSTEETRWQLPVEPHTHRDTVVQANKPGNICPAGSDSPVPPGFNYTGSEDCLVLNVYKPRGATNLPVFVWIHGGGYGLGSANDVEFTNLIKQSNNGFVAVAIQYRLGAFGFLGGADLKKNGATNLGLYDQQFALKWVQKHITKFGGDPKRVTIGGESAGAGSVMLQTLAFGGTQGNSLFQNMIAASPYLPTQPTFNDEEPTSSYLRFAKSSGCYSGPTEGQAKTFRPDGSILKCLRGKDSATLQKANSVVSGSVLFGQWAFIPVTDGGFLRDLPSRQLASQKVNGQRMLVGNNADEGVMFTPQNFTSTSNFQNFVRTLFPQLDESDAATIVAAYPTLAGTSAESKVRYGTRGDAGLTALDVSPFALGQQQRANNLYAEATFVCPSYWMSDAYSAASGGYSARTSYHYQYSVLPALHGFNQAPNLGEKMPYVGNEFIAAITSTWGNFIIRNDPRAPASPVAAIRSFAPWSAASSTSSKGGRMLNFNQTGGTPATFTYPFNITSNVFYDPGLEPAVNEVDAYSWEGGRGRRCDLLRQLGSKIQE